MGISPGDIANLYKAGGATLVALAAFAIAFFVVLGAFINFVVTTMKTMVPASLLVDQSAAADRLCAQQHCSLEDQLGAMGNDLVAIKTKLGV